MCSSLLDPALAASWHCQRGCLSASLREVVRSHEPAQSVPWADLLRPESDIRKQFYRHVKDDLLIADQEHCCVQGEGGESCDICGSQGFSEEVLSKPLGSDPGALWSAYREAGAKLPLEKEQLLAAGFPCKLVEARRSALRLDEWRILHKRHCNLCGKCHADHLSLDSSCYFYEMIQCLERGFTIPIDHSAMDKLPKRENGSAIPLHADFIPAVGPDYELLKDRAKEDKWRARISPEELSLAREDCWVASAFVARKKVYRELDFREPRVVSSFDKTINNFTKSPSFSLISVGDIISSIKKHDLVGALDLSSAFLQVPMAMEHWHFLGVQSDPDDPNYFDLYRKLPFGLNVAPLIFSMFSAEVARICRGLGLRVWSYLDDFPIVCSSRTARKEFALFQRVVKRLGLVFKPSKLQPPAEEVTILGVRLNLEKGLVALKKGYASTLMPILLSAADKGPTIGELRSLVGRLNYISMVFPPGRLRMRGLYLALHLAREIAGRRVAQALATTGSDRVVTSARGNRRSAFPLAGTRAPRLTREHFGWWLNQVSALAKREEEVTCPAELSKGQPHGVWEKGPLVLPLQHTLKRVFIQSDASLEVSAAALWKDWVYIAHRMAFTPFFENTCDAELLAAVLPILVQPEDFAGCCVVCRVDNAGACFVLNSFRSRREHVSRVLRFIADCQVRYNFLVVAEWCPREENSWADLWSRVDDLRNWTVRWNHSPSDPQSRPSLLRLRDGTSVAPTISNAQYFPLAHIFDRT